MLKIGLKIKSAVRRKSWKKYLFTWSETEAHCKR